ncbi:hypothetical protein [Streptomyces decoyicus]
MTSVAQTDEPTHVRGRTGTASLVLGVVTIVLMGWPWLPLPSWIRCFPVYFIVPVGICAVVFGISALRSVRGEPGADRCRAWVGTVLGTVAIVVPLMVIVGAVAVLECW